MRLRVLGQLAASAGGAPVELAGCRYAAAAEIAEKVGGGDLGRKARKAFTRR